MKATWIQMTNRCRITLDAGIFKTRCCDCGLVHIWKIHAGKKNVWFEVIRDNRATGQVRRHKCY
ncbi:MAG: hypothetical protein FJ045_01770 [Crenarchaeota archaeon]|nr:hypothetical protein [Thermoproteota archaeon]